MCPSPLQGNPIHASTGNKFQQETDFRANTPFPLSIVRSYNSHDIDGPHFTFGRGWRGRYFGRLFTQDPNSAYLYHADGSLHHWSLTADRFVSPTEPGSSLVKTPEGWTHTDRSGNVTKYDQSGSLIEIVNSDGLSHRVSYDSFGRIDQVTDSFGNTLSYEYDTRFLVRAIHTPDGATYRYDYDDSGNLIAVIYPDETPEDPTDNPRKHYHYEDPRFRFILTGITDENGHRAATWSYDDSGRAISSAHAEGTDNFTFQYNEDGTTQITDPLEQARTFHFTSPTGVVRIESVEGGACPGCGGKNAAYQYDEQGLVRQKTDQNGHRVSYVRDADGRELERTEAPGSPEARTVTTEWHPDFRKPVRIREPGLITEFRYDPQGRLLSRTERAAP